MSEPGATVDLRRKGSGIKKPVIRDIKAARRDGDDMMALIVELGRAARAMTYDNGDVADLYNSLTRVAAVAVSIARSL